MPTISTDEALALEWHLPESGPGIDEMWLDAYLATRLCDVLSRRHYGVSFKELSVEDRCLIRGEVETFIARQTWIQRKRR